MRFCYIAINHVGRCRCEQLAGTGHINLIFIFRRFTCIEVDTVDVIYIGKALQEGYDFRFSGAVPEIAFLAGGAGPGLEEFAKCVVDARLVSGRIKESVAQMDRYGDLDLYVLGTGYIYLYKGAAVRSDVFGYIVPQDIVRYGFKLIGRSGGHYNQ